MKPKFQFSNVVVVEDILIGIILKTWNDKDSYNYDVYIRYHNIIKNYKEEEIKHFIYNKLLSEDEIEYYE